MPEEVVLYFCITQKGLLNSCRMYIRIRFLNFIVLRVLTIVLTISALSIPLSAEVDVDLGKKLFKSNCASCHKLDKKLIGPALAGVTQRRSEEWLLRWIRNNAELRASGDADAKAIFEEYNGSIMSAFPALADDDIKSILAYTDAVPVVAPPKEISPGLPIAEPVNDSLLLYIFGGFLILFVTLLLQIRNTLKEINGQNKSTVIQDFNLLTQWLVGNKRFMTAATIVSTVAFLYQLFWFLMGIGVETNYQPVQPIAFSHKIHAGENQVDCNYCHSSARHSKHSGIPSTNVCMNCHMYIDGSEILNDAGVAKYAGERSPEIAKIYSAIGWDAENRSYIDNYETKPVRWIRIHNLPDLAYFNHAQHVTAGGVECQTCHGPVQEMDVVYQYSKLTMGWCINCHRETEVNTSNGYYADAEEGTQSINERLALKFHDELITVEKIGGLECGKCHY
ncbi:MAG: Menaquinone reductase, multiheme cytochrome c subunit [Owenweeksia sp. TMED14]|mgnify:CR=1 FL=1|nr:MAG: Menaquinone reductase, multiheme cytochrome c subunit [Owenweeksia sp. TMED14]